MPCIWTEMGDIPLPPEEDILAEPEEPGFFSTLAYLFERTGSIIAGNGWFFLGGALAAYYVWTKYGDQFVPHGSAKPVSQKDLKDFQYKEEQRLKHLAKLQEKYDKESAERAAQLQALEEEKKRARLAELEKLSSKITPEGSKLDEPSSSSNSGSRPAKKPKTQSLRPEYNPLMGDTSSSRACFRGPSSGRSGG